MPQQNEDETLKAKVEEKVLVNPKTSTTITTEVSPNKSETLKGSNNTKDDEPNNITSNSEIYTTVTSEEPIEEVNIFDDKEIYGIMEIEGDDNEDIYVDGTGMNEDEGQFILVNYKASGDKYIIEEEVEDEGHDEEEGVYDEQIDKPQRKRHVKRMPREIVERYAQTVDSNQHVCTKCVKVFSTRTNLIRHIQSHDGNKPYVCPECSKGFTQSGSLKQHMYIHSGERPYKCTYCERAFTQGKSLKFHLRRHMNEKPFTCDHCNSNFRQRDGLKRHLKTRHNIELKHKNGQDEKISIAFVSMEQDEERKDDDGKIMEICEESKDN